MTRQHKLDRTLVSWPQVSAFTEASERGTTNRGRIFRYFRSADPSCSSWSVICSILAHSTDFVENKVRWHDGGLDAELIQAAKKSVDIMC